MCKYRANKVFKAMLFTIIIGIYPNFQKLNDEKNWGNAICYNITIYTH